MELPPKALNVLANIKAELLSRQELTPLESVEGDGRSVIITLSRPKTEPKVTVFMRHARRPNAFQKMCQRREF
jgi:hypothetical protein